MGNNKAEYSNHGGDSESNLPECVRIVRELVDQWHQTEDTTEETRRSTCQSQSGLECGKILRSKNKFYVVEVRICMRSQYEKPLSQQDEKTFMQPSEQRER